MKKKKPTAPGNFYLARCCAYPMAWVRNQDHSADLVRLGNENPVGPLWIHLRVDLFGIHISNVECLNIDGFDPASNELGYQTLIAGHMSTPFVIPIEGVVLDHPNGVKVEIDYNQYLLEGEGAVPLSLENWLQLDLVVLDQAGTIDPPAQKELAASIKSEIERYQAGMDALYYDR